jgi:hypothetical protein
VRVEVSNPVLAVHDLDHRAEILKTPTDKPWGRREMALRSPHGHRFMLGQALAT